MRGQFIRSYRSAKGNTVFVYKVLGTEQELQNFKAAQGEFAREDEEKNPLWFTTRFVGKTPDLIITSNKKIVADMSAYDQAASIASQYGGNFGEQLAKAAAMQLTGMTPVDSTVQVGAGGAIDSL